MSTIQRKRDAQRAKVIDHYLDLAEKQPYNRISREAIAQGLDMVPTNINHIFGTIDMLRDEMMAEAVATERLTVIAQGLALRNPIAKAAPDELKKRALETLI